MINKIWQGQKIFWLMGRFCPTGRGTVAQRPARLARPSGKSSRGRPSCTTRCAPTKCSPRTGRVRWHDSYRRTGWWVARPSAVRAAAVGSPWRHVWQGGEFTSRRWFSVGAKAMQWSLWGRRCSWNSDWGRGVWVTHQFEGKDMQAGLTVEGMTAVVQCYPARGSSSGHRGLDNLSWRRMRRVPCGQGGGEKCHTREKIWPSWHQRLLKWGKWHDGRGPHLWRGGERDWRCGAQCSEDDDRGAVVRSGGRRCQRCCHGDDSKSFPSTNWGDTFPC
jgi:hypothetical protein